MNCAVRVFFVLAIFVLFAGCAATRYERTVTIQRDGQGNIIGIEEVEHMTQTRSAKKLPTFYIFDKGDVPAK